jgi:protein-S-isoprenylcysteine O-methyltransferase Ste14
MKNILTMITHPDPVGTPGLAILTAGGILFAMALLQSRRAARGPSVAPARRSRASIAGVLLQMLGFFTVGLGPIAATLRPTGFPALLQAVIVAALMIICVSLFVAATRAMGRNWSVVARMRTDHELVTRGVFAHLRHPIYVGMAFFLFALAFAFGHMVNLVAGAPLFLLGTWIRVHEEERLLSAQFGAAYSDYAARVKRFLPGII